MKSKSTARAILCNSLMRNHCKQQRGKALSHSRFIAARLLSIARRNHRQTLLVYTGLSGLIWGESASEATCRGRGDNWPLAAEIGRDLMRPKREGRGGNGRKEWKKPARSTGDCCDIRIEGLMPNQAHRSSRENPKSGGAEKSAEKKRTGVSRARADSNRSREASACRPLKGRARL